MTLSSEFFLASFSLFECFRPSFRDFLLVTFSRIFTGYSRILTNDDVDVDDNDNDDDVDNHEHDADDDDNDVDNDDEGNDDLHLLQGVKRGEQACHLLHLDKKGVIVLLCNQRILLDFSQILPGFWEQRLAGSSGRSHLKAFPSPTPSL